MELVLTFKEKKNSYGALRVLHNNAEVLKQEEQGVSLCQAKSSNSCAVTYKHAENHCAKKGMSLYVGF